MNARVHGMPKAPRTTLAPYAALYLIGLIWLFGAVAAQPDAGAGPFKVGVSYRSFVIDKDRKSVV